MEQIKFLFGLKDRVTRKPYILWGVGLLILKYLGELLFYYLGSSHFLSPLNFLSPMLSQRYPDFRSLPDWFTPVVVVWSIPFIWIGVGMSIRRAVDAGLSPWWGIVFFVPGLNFLLMFVLSCKGTSAKSREWNVSQKRIEDTHLLSSLVLTFIFVLLGTSFTWLSTNFLRVYATSLFVGAPVVLGLVQGYFLNYKRPQSFKSTVGFVCLTILLIHLMLMIFALEGVVCVAMSLPICLPLGIMGAIFGAGISQYGKLGSFTPIALVLILPVMPWLESKTMVPHKDIVVSSIEINAPPENVWPNVVKFADLPPTTEWLFKLGIAYPVRARIEGHGVGAVRRCEFSTGAFVEPITVWDEPTHLAFNVKYQPQPLKELSFYDHVDAPHLNGYFRSVQGEFRLIPIAGGKTLLEGRTWYEMDIHPGWYWQIYGRWFIHKIHERVLAHIKNLSET